MSSNNESFGSSDPRARRGSFTTQTFNNIFGRSNSTSGGPITTTAAQDQRRRMSISTLGLSGTSPSLSTPFTPVGRRGSVSTAGSNSIDESAIDDDDSPGPSQPTTPYARRMSFGAQAFRTVRGNASPGSSGESGGFNWSEQLRSRAESSVSQSHRPSFSAFQKNTQPIQAHERAKSVSEMPAPPTVVTAPPPKPPRKPDAFQERILKGDFYMD